MLLEQDKRVTVTLHLIEIVIQELQKAYDDPPKKFQALDFRATVLTLLKHLRDLSVSDVRSLRLAATWAFNSLSLGESS